MDKFDEGSFREALRAPKDTTRNFHVCGTKNPDKADYHVHFTWRFPDEKEQINLEIEYVRGPQKPREDEVEPFAEDVMQWVGRFFKFGDANARVLADFEFKGGAAHPWFPLPLKTKIVALKSDAEIDGIAVLLPSQPQGIGRIYLSEIKDSVFLEIQAESRVDFAKFSLNSELQKVRDFAANLVEVEQ
ncbi:MAG TPA: hypothetical protein VJP04_04510 [Terriglobales bacterium]|nr:hypothetical protein [Terriglobales bacterium]